MSERDVERDCRVETFVASLRRLADCLEKKEPFRIQVVNRRFTVPMEAVLSIEHESEGGEEELEFQLKWRSSDA